MPLPARYRRLWRRRLRRRPLLPFLLLATLACCSTSTVAIKQPTGPDPDNPWLMSLGGTLAIFGITGIWISGRWHGWVQRVLVSSLWLVVVCYLLRSIEGGMRAIGTIGFVVVLITAIFAALIRLPSWWRSRALRKVTRQVTIGYLLLLTTFVAIGIMLMQQLDQEILIAITVDPKITGFLLAEIGAAPAFLLVSRICRSTVVASFLMALLTLAFLIALNLAFTHPIPSLFQPPHYYHLGLFLTTAIWILGTRRQQSPNEGVLDDAASRPTDSENRVAAESSEPPASIDLRA